MSNQYIESLKEELEQMGVKPPSAFGVQQTVHVNDMDLKCIMDMQKATGVTYSDEQLKILEHRGNACILACAGSGKTTVSTHLIAKRILSGEIKDINKMIYTTYSKAGATEMKTRLDKLLKQLGINKDVQVRTLHSFFLQVLRTFGVTSNIIKESMRTQFIKEACKEVEYTPRDEDLMLLDNLLSYQVNNLLNDKKTIDSYVNTLDDLSLEQYSKIRSAYANKKAEKGLIDYDDMQSYLYLWLVKFAKSSKPDEVQTAEAVRNYCKAMWTDFYIDEAQDVSKIQFAIIRAMIADPNDRNKLTAGLVFIGDDDQCIYTWRGSDPSIILTCGSTFDIKVFKLTTNYRCYNEIVDYAANGVKHNSSRYEKDMNAFERGGSVKIAMSPKEDLCNLSIIALNHIKYWLRHGEKLGDIAVLSRNNFHLALLSNMLLREGIYCNMTEDMKLTKSYLYSDIKGIIDLCSDNYSHHLTSKLLWKMCRYMGAKNANAIADLQNNSGLSFKDLISYLTKRFINHSIPFSKTLYIGMQAEQKIAYHMGGMASDTKTDIEAIYHALCSENKAETFGALAFLYTQSCGNFLYKSRDKKRSMTGLITYIKNLIMKDGYDKMLDFLRVTEQLEGGSMVIPGEKMTLTTIHSAKGREWKNVIMFACDNVTSPSFDGIVKMLEDEISVHDISEHLSEERRLFYVGNTRAKENLVTITYNTPSVFILEALGVIGTNANNNYDIIKYAEDQDWFEQFKNKTYNILTDMNGKYYYDFEKYLKE